MRGALNMETDRSATIAMLPTTDKNEPRALVFVVDPQRRKEIETRLGRVYELTKAETGTLMAFWTTMT